MENRGLLYHYKNYTKLGGKAKGREETWRNGKPDRMYWNVSFQLGNEAISGMNISG